MNDLLRSIDPDGSLLADYMMRARRPGANAEDLTALLQSLKARGFLRDPDEPTLAEIREKVTLFERDLKSGMFGDDMSGNWVKGALDACRRFRAYLEPRKPEPVPVAPILYVADRTWDGRVTYRPATAQERFDGYRAADEAAAARRARIEGDSLEGGLDL